MSSNSGWDSFARTNASQRWRQPSAAMGRQMTEAIVAAARVQPNMRVLDIASGTGEPAISIATQLGGTGLVIASDYSPGPLKIAAGRAAQRGLTNICFVPADVHHLPFAAESFARVTCRLGVMFFSDMPRAARELHRVLRPGGRATFLAWGSREQPYFDALAGTILRELPEIEVPASALEMFKYSEPGTLAAILSAAGFSETEETFTSVPWNWPGTPEELWVYFREVTIPFKPLLEAVPAEARAQVDAAVLGALRGRYDGRCVNFLAEIALVSATR